MSISGYSHYRTCRLCGAGFIAHTAFAELGLDDTICIKCQKEDVNRGVFDLGIRRVVEDEYGWWIMFHCGCEAWHAWPFNIGQGPEPFINDQRHKGIWAHGRRK